MRHSEIGAARELSAAMSGRSYAQHTNGRNYTTRSHTMDQVLKDGYKLGNSLPSELAERANGIEVRPWREGQEHILTKRLAQETGSRLREQADGLEQAATRLHGKVEINDGDFQHAKQVAGYWKQVAGYFEAVHKVMTKHNVAISVDE